MAAADEVERLYGLDPAAFVAERDAAAKRLRQEGDRAGARVVAGLKRPTAAAGIVNRVVRAAPDGVEELRGAADALAEAAAAGDPAALRAATARERQAVEALVQVAREVDPDLPQQTLQHVRETLHAAGIDPDQRDQALSGRLEKEVVAAGLGALLGTSSAPRRPTPGRPARERPAPPAEPEPAADAPPEKTQRRAEAAEARRQREAEAAARRTRIDEARTARDAARDAQRAARQSVSDATRALREAEAAAERCREQLRDAESDLGAAEETLAAAESALTDARDS
jgi:hypothetical protein